MVNTLGELFGEQLGARVLSDGHRHDDTIDRDVVILLCYQRGIHSSLYLGSQLGTSVEFPRSDSGDKEFRLLRKDVLKREIIRFVIGVEIKKIG